MSIRPKVLLNDASVLLNLLATDCLGVIASDLNWQFAICSAVRDEATRLRDPASGDMVPVDLAALLVRGSLQMIELSGEAEQSLYIEQASVVDDGEAMSLALAASRGLELAMDDKRAINHARRVFPGMRI